MKGVDSFRIPSFKKGFWKSWKIPGLDFWESRDQDFEKNLENPGIPGYPRIPQEPDHVIPGGASQLRVRDLWHKDRSRDQVAASAVTRRKPFREREELFHV